MAAPVDRISDRHRVGVAQLERLDEYVTIKRSIVERYATAFRGSRCIRPHPEPAHCRSIFWMYSVRSDREARPQIDKLNAADIMARPLWVPLHRLPAFKDSCLVHHSEQCDELHATGLSLPCSVALTTNDQQRVIEALNQP
jgi:dTDP-4-amino-4,6-dideoxygalactose transaminase